MIRVDPATIEVPAALGPEGKGAKETAEAIAFYLDEATRLTVASRSRSRPTAKKW